MAPRHLALMAAIVIFWGLNFVVGKMALQEWPPILFTSARFSFLALCLIPFLKWHSGQMGIILQISLAAGALHFALFFSGLSVSNASVAAVFAQLAPPFSTILAVTILKEQVGIWRIGGIGMAFLGVTIIAFDPAVFEFRLGALFMTIAALSYGYANVIVKSLDGVSVFQLQAWIAMISAPLLLVGAFLFEGGEVSSIETVSPIVIGAVLYMAVFASLIGHGGVFFLIQRYDVSLVSGYLLLAPCVGFLAGVWFLDEPVTVKLIAGGLMTVGGVAVITFRERLNQQKTDHADA